MTKSLRKGFDGSTDRSTRGATVEVVNSGGFVATDRAHGSEGWVICTRSVAGRVACIDTQTLVDLKCNKNIP